MDGTDVARRTLRERVPDRVVDGSLFVVTAAIVLAAASRRGAVPATLPDWVLYTDWILGALGCVALWWRRRFPVVLAAALILLSVLSEAVSTPAIVALFTVAVHRSARTTMVLCLASLAALTGHQLIRPESVASQAMLFVVIVLGHVAVVTWGLSVRHRRELVATLRERAEAARVETRLRAERSHHEARASLARDMHDVLGHRLSLLSVHAGALAFSQGATAEDTARASEVIRENAHRALQELREVIGVLQAPVGELPSPVAEDVLELIEEAVEAGTEVKLRDEAGVTSGARSAPPSQSRVLFRLVQEALTNVRKHAPGASVEIRLTGRPGEHLTAEIVNTSPSAASSPSSGSGSGLRGLAERARLGEGGLDYGPADSGGWRVRMWLPWPR
ncbi:sensor histidine kinase [Amycolatopsis thailandensis]|uniref:histidine kinase n=1 Tax=Amycolatopsis thailandensis TaxID=589330 RepID=A0A229SB24_9PSEU|nr:histidine kinase [Amycolatopsis thailandensis]OXM56133.1 sensor histidine kinase [Amycolatopsis thailandensis]